jgi:hypothetical protein
VVGEHATWVITEESSKHATDKGLHTTTPAAAPPFARGRRPPLPLPRHQPAGLAGALRRARLNPSPGRALRTAPIRPAPQGKPPPSPLKCPAPPVALSLQKGRASSARWAQLTGPCQCCGAEWGFQARAAMGTTAEHAPGGGPRGAACNKLCKAARARCALAPDKHNGRGKGQQVSMASGAPGLQARRRRPHTQPTHLGCCGSGAGCSLRSSCSQKRPEVGTS